MSFNGQHSQTNTPVDPARILENFNSRARELGLTQDYTYRRTEERSPQRTPEKDSNFSPHRTITLERAKRASPCRYEQNTAYSPNKTQTNVQLFEENDVLRETNIQLQKSINILNKELINLRTATPTIFMSNHQEHDNKLSQVSAENERLKNQLKEKIQRIEFLKVQNEMKTDAGRNMLDSQAANEQLKKRLKLELEVQLEEQSRALCENLKNRTHIAEGELECLKADQETKDKEMELVDNRFKRQQKDHNDALEDFRKGISNKLRQEYQIKMSSKTEEFELRVKNSLDEVERLTKVINDWRAKCAGADKRCIELIHELDEKSAHEVNLRKLLAQLEDKNLHLSGEREKSEIDYQEKSYTEQQLINKIKIIEEENSDILTKFEKYELQCGEMNARNKVLDRELKQKNEDFVIMRSELNKKQEELGHKEIRIMKLESELKIRSGEVDGVKRALHDNMFEQDSLTNLTKNLENGLRMKEGGNGCLEELIEKLKVELSRSEQECFNERKELEVLTKDNFELRQMQTLFGSEKEDFLKRIENLEKDALYLANTLIEKENYYGQLEEEGEAYKEYVMKMNTEGLKLEKEVQEKDNFIKTLEKFNEQNKSFHEGTLEDKEFFKNRYTELKEESEKLIQVNQQMRRELDDIKDKCRLFEKDGKDTDQSLSLARKEQTELKYQLANKDEAVRKMTAERFSDGDRQELFMQRSEKTRLEEHLKYLQDNENETTKKVYREESLRGKVLKDFEELKIHNDEVKFELEKTRSDCALWKLKCDENEKIVTHYKNAGKEGVKIVTKENESIRIEKEEQNNNYRDAINELNILREKYDRLQRSTNDADKNYISFNNTISDKDRMLEDYRNENQNLRGQLHRSASSLNEMKDSMNNSDKQNLEKMIYELRSENIELKNLRLTENESMRNVIEEERERYIQDLTNLKSENEKLENKLIWLQNEGQYVKAQQSNEYMNELTNEKLMMVKRIEELENEKEKSREAYEDEKYKYIKFKNENAKLNDRIARLLNEQRPSEGRNENMPVNADILNENELLKKQMNDIDNLKRQAKEKLERLQKECDRLNEENLLTKLNEDNNAKEYSKALKELNEEKDQLIEEKQRQIDKLLEDNEDEDEVVIPQKQQDNQNQQNYQSGGNESITSKKSKGYETLCRFYREDQEVTKKKTKKIFSMQKSIGRELEVQTLKNKQLSREISELLEKNNAEELVETRVAQCKKALEEKEETFQLKMKFIEQLQRQIEKLEDMNRQVIYLLTVNKIEIGKEYSDMQISNKLDDIKSFRSMGETSLGNQQNRFESSLQIKILNNQIDRTKNNKINKRLELIHTKYVQGQFRLTI